MGKLRVFPPKGRLKILFIYFWRQGEVERETETERETERERHQSVASRMPPTGDLAFNLGVCPNRESN